jgi:hypothetical protein
MFIFIGHIFLVLSRFWNLKEGVGLDCILEIMFDFQFLPLPSSCALPSD